MIFQEDFLWDFFRKIVRVPPMKNEKIWNFFSSIFFVQKLAWDIQKCLLEVFWKISNQFWMRSISPSKAFNHQPLFDIPAFLSFELRILRLEKIQSNLHIFVCLCFHLIDCPAQLKFKCFEIQKGGKFKIIFLFLALSYIILELAI